MLDITIIVQCNTHALQNALEGLDIDNTVIASGQYYQVVVCSRDDVGELVQRLVNNSINCKVFRF